MTGCFRVFQGVFRGVFENTLPGWLGCFFPPLPPLRGGGKKKHPASRRATSAPTPLNQKNENTLAEEQMQDDAQLPEYVIDEAIVELEREGLIYSILPRRSGGERIWKLVEQAKKGEPADA